MILVLWNTERIATELAFCGLAPSGARPIPQNQCLQGPGTHDRLRVRNDAADELLGGVAHLGHGDRDLTLSRLIGFGRVPLREPVAARVRSYRARPRKAVTSLQRRAVAPAGHPTGPI